uniref:Endonuclease/exonuclease/phosphatase domain-containing protein n=1 Tax=Electrophorus electricus TaxID=8005 RepID=A0A4W4HJE4_ELEEL
MKIASYNVRHLGPKKLNDEDVRNYLIKIVSYCSIIVILEEVNKKGYGMANFLQELNSTGLGTATLSCTKQPQLKCYQTLHDNEFQPGGVATIYHAKTVTVAGKTVKNHVKNCLECALLALFACMCVCAFTVLTDFVLIPVHTKPHDSVKELDELYDVCMAVREKWNIDVSLNTHLWGLHLQEENEADQNLHR